jgi:hypothetical protein
MLTATLGLLTSAALAGDVTGKWSAETQGRDGEKRTTTFNLKADGGKLTGTVSNPMGEREISEGKIDGENISFVVNMEFNGNAVKLNYTGKVSGDEIKFKREAGDHVQEFTAKRSAT